MKSAWTNLAQKRFVPRANAFVRGKTAYYLFATLLAISCGAVAWRSLNYVSAARPYADSGTFSGVAMHVMAGEVPYKDAWEQKPPMIFFLNALAMSLGDTSITSIRDMERNFAFLRATLLFTILLLGLRNVWIAFFSTLAYTLLFYRAELFTQGNSTEEYATVFALAGILFSLLAKDTLRRRRSLIFTFFAGFFFSIATLTKEPFLFSSVAWFFFLLFQEKTTVRTVLIRAGIFIAGALTPFLAIVLYLGINGAIDDWIDALSFSFTYSEERARPFFDKIFMYIGLTDKLTASPLITIKIAFGLGLLATFHKTLNKQTRYFPLVAALGFALDFYATTLSGKSHSHYFLQSCAGYITIVACGAALLVHTAPKVSISRLAFPFLLLFGLLVWDFAACKTYAIQLKAPFERDAKISAVSSYIHENSAETDRIWTPNGQGSYFYLSSQRLSPSKYLHCAEMLFCDTWLTTKEEKLEYLQTTLKNNPPKFIPLFKLTPEHQHDGVRILKAAGLYEWFAANYKLVNIKDGKHVLYIRDESKTSTP